MKSLHILNDQDTFIVPGTYMVCREMLERSAAAIQPDAVGEVRMAAYSHAKNTIARRMIQFSVLGIWV